jgi:hypothetical protein
MRMGCETTNYFFDRFSLCFFLLSSRSFLVIGFFLALPMLNEITVQRIDRGMIKSLCKRARMENCLATEAG